MGPTGKKGIAKPRSERIQTTIERKSLKTLQRGAGATDKENLAGRPVTIEIKDAKIMERTKLIETRKKTVNSKGIQAGADSKIQVEDLTSDAGPSENYWEIIAERRRVALEETLEENQKLREENEKLKLLVEESKNLVDVLTEMVGEQEESGIDLAEGSTLNDTSLTGEKSDSDNS